MIKKYEAPHCATSSILLLLHPSQVQIFSSEPHSQTPSVYALPLMRPNLTPIQKTGKIMVLNIFTFTFLDTSSAKDSGPNGSKHSPNSLLLICLFMQFCCSQKSQFFHTFKGPIHHLYAVLLSCHLNNATSLDSLPDQPPYKRLIQLLSFSV
jgi:hypothetical protein